MIQGRTWLAASLVAIIACQAAIAQDDGHEPRVDEPRVVNSASAFIDVSDEAPLRSLAPWALHWEDLDGNADLATARSQIFATVDGRYIDFGFSTAVQWLMIPIENTGSTTAKRYLAFNMRFMQQLDTFLVTEGAVSRVLSNHMDSPFGARPIPHRHLIGEFELAAGERATLFVRYWSEGTTALPLSIETPLSKEQLKSGQNFRHGAFYAFVAVLLLYSILFGLLSRQRLFVAYAAYLTSVVLYLAHMDGYTFQFLWPNLPVWNAAAALPLGMGLNVGAALFSMEFLKTRERHPRLHLAMVCLAIGCVVYVASSAFVSQSTLKQFAFLITTLFSFFYLSCGIYSWLQGHRDVRFYIVGWFGMATAASITALVHFAGGEYPVSISFEIIRLGILVDATMMGVAVADQFNSARRARVEAQKLVNESLAERLKLQERFLTLEQRFHAASAAADERGLQLAEASHDLRQPLAALRSSLGGNQSAESQTQIRKTVEYLEGLVDRYLVETAAASESPADGETADLQLEREAEVEVVPVQVVFDHLAWLFEKDARDAGVALRFAKTSSTVRIAPLVLVRLLSNALSNSIRYTAEHGRVLVGVRRRPDGPVVMVLDNGPGIPARELARLQQPYERGAAQHAERGFGLGLAITRELAEEQGIEWTLDSVESRGTCVAFSFRRLSATVAA